jgi:hypothetical protein
VGRDVDDIVKDLVEAALGVTRARLTELLREQAAAAAEDAILSAMTGLSEPDKLAPFRCGARGVRAGVCGRACGVVARAGKHRGTRMPGWRA